MRKQALLLLVATVLGACGGSGAMGPTSPGQAPPVAPVANSSNRKFDIAVLVDAQAPTVDRADIERVLARANGKVLEKTGEEYRAAEIVYGLARGSSVPNMAAAYVATKATNTPEGVLVLTNDEVSFRFGGYSVYFRPPFPFQNEFPSPVPAVGSANVYLAAIHFDHIYASCGYDDNLNRISDVSVGGECRNRPGTPCVQRGSVWMCADALNDLYADHDYFTACGIVHEFLHPFGSEGNLDHYGSQQCRERTGMSAALAADTREFELNCGICPDLYTRFRHRP